jgi:RNA polymerase sigma factor (TIGR02999 family)
MTDRSSPVARPVRRKLELKRLMGDERPLPVLSDASASDVTGLLRQWERGDHDALNRLVPLVYAELRRIARRRLDGERSAQSLTPTVLVHEAYLRLIDVRHAGFRDRAHFLAMASRVMRRLLIDRARARRAARRGGGAEVVEWDDDLVASDAHAAALDDLDEALTRLEALDPRQGQIVEQRYFGGLTLEETAEVIGVSLATVKRELRFAHAWLAAALGPSTTARGRQP